MESRYGIGINNRYALFLDSEDGEDLNNIMAKKKAIAEQTKTTAMDTATTKPIKKADGTDKKMANNQINRATKDSKPSNREGKSSLSL